MPMTQWDEKELLLGTRNDVLSLKEPACKYEIRGKIAKPLDGFNFIEEGTRIVTSSE